MDMQSDDTGEMGEEQAAPGGVSKIVEQVGSGLAQLAQALDSSPATTDQDRAAIADIMGKFTALVEKHLGAGPGEDPEAEEEAMPSVVSAEGGRSGVPAGPQGMARG